MGLSLATCVLLLAQLPAVNEERARFGAGPLVHDPALDAAARWMAADCDRRKTLDHVDSLGRAPWDRARAFGYPGFATEGQSWGSGEPAGLRQPAWEGHHRDLVDPRWTRFGFGRSGAFVVTMFGD